MCDTNQAQTITELDTWLRSALGGHVAGLGKDTLVALGQLGETVRKVQQEAAGEAAPASIVRHSHIHTHGSGAYALTHLHPHTHSRGSESHDTTEHNTPG
jgi:hypothetical protein